MADQDMEKTEQATPKRREEAREKGQVAKSQEISSLAVLMTGTAALYYLFSIFFLFRYDNAVDKNIVADRFMYLPSLGICILVGHWVDQLFFATYTGEAPLELCPVRN